MKLHTGVDIIRLDRVLGMRRPEAFAQKILTSLERHEYQARLDSNQRSGLRYLAKAFCAKEAASKALGCGFGALLGFKDISTLRSESGKPELVINDSVLCRIYGEKARVELSVSISDEEEYAVAFVVALVCSPEA